MNDGLVVASNRGPVRWQVTDDGHRVPRRGFGGLVTALGDALAHEPGQWVSLALDQHDREVAAEHAGAAFPVDLTGRPMSVRLIDAGERFEPYYETVSNQWLWFTLHDLWGAPYEPQGVGWREAWYDAYLPINAEVGAAVAEAADDDTDVLLQDYHLLSAGRTVRDQRPQAPLLHYVHTPWAPPRMLSRLPDPVIGGILDGLLAADVVAFSSPKWCAELRACAEAFAGATRDGDALVVDGRHVVVADFTLGVDADALAATTASEEVRAAGERLDELCGDRQMLLRADRTDLSKNILRGLRAFERLLERQPQLAERVWHYANLNPSRQGVPAYRAYLDACRTVADRIAERFGPHALTMEVGDDYPAVIAAFQRYDVLLTNPVVDGTNLVAKEGPTLNERDGVLVLSRHAGAADRLGEPALVINPYDVEGTSDALAEALAMEAGERRARAARLRTEAAVGAPEQWLAAQRRVLREAVAGRRA